GALVEGRVGVYFAHSEHPSAVGPVNCYAAVGFNDLVDLRRLQPDLAGNPVTFRVHYHPPAFADHQRRMVSGKANQARQPTPFAFPAAGEKPWRRLSVEVKAGRVRIRCDDQEIVDAARGDLGRAFAGMTEDMNLLAAATFSAPPSFAPRGGLGLF